MTPSFDPGFTTPEMAAVFSAGSRVARMVAVEAALAKVGAAAGVIPAEAAGEIEAACRIPLDDPDGLLENGWREGTPVMPVLDAIRARLSESAGRWLHHGATTQDVVDTALAAQMTAGRALLERDLTRLGDRLADLAAGHRNTPMVGRTFLQPAQAVTFGLVAARWLDPVVTAVDALRHTRFPVQLGGPVGTMSGFGDLGPAVVERLAFELGLEAPAVSWHTDRTPVTAVTMLLDRTASTMAKIAADIVLLSGYGEVEVRAGRSSSMPHKRNPIDSVRAIAAATACHGAASTLGGPRHLELERGIGGWHAEWWAVPMVFHTAAAAVAATTEAATSLTAVPDRMAENLAASGLAPDPGPSVSAIIDAVLARRAGDER